MFKRLTASFHAAATAPLSPSSKRGAGSAPGHMIATNNSTMAVSAMPRAQEPTRPGLVASLGPIPRPQMAIRSRMPIVSDLALVGATSSMAPYSLLYMSLYEKLVGHARSDGCEVVHRGCLIIWVAARHDRLQMFCPLIRRSAARHDTSLRASTSTAPERTDIGLQT